jgi:hypothetical protein
MKSKNKSIWKRKRKKYNSNQLAISVMRSKKIHRKQIKKIWNSTFNKSNVEGRNQDKKKKKNMAYNLIE